MQEFPGAPRAFEGIKCLLVIPLLAQAPDFFRTYQGTVKCSACGRAVGYCITQELLYHCRHKSRCFHIVLSVLHLSGCTSESEKKIHFPFKNIITFAIAAIRHGPSPRTSSTLNPLLHSCYRHVMQTFKSHIIHHWRSSSWKHFQPLLPGCYIFRLAALALSILAQLSLCSSYKSKMVLLLKSTANSTHQKKKRPKKQIKTVLKREQESTATPCRGRVPLFLYLVSTIATASAATGNAVPVYCFHRGGNFQEIIATILFALVTSGQ